MSALENAIARSYTVTEPTEPGPGSPMSPLGRRRLSWPGLTAQAVSTTAPAASMVALPVVLLAAPQPAGLIVMVATALLVGLFALVTTFFTRRQAAAGGLASFAYQGGGPGLATATAVTMLVKLLGSAVLTFGAGIVSLGVVLGAPGLVVVPSVVVATLIATVLVRGVRTAMLALLVVEVASLLLVLAVMWSGDPGPVGVAVPAAGSETDRLLVLALVTAFALAGFESATFFGPETRRPLVTVSRVVLLTPLVCGALLVAAAVAALSGRADDLLGAYLDPASSGVSPTLVTLLHAGLCCSLLASATGSVHAASRLVWSLGVERVLPGRAARCAAVVHPRFRTPHRVLLVLAVAVAVGGALVAAALHSATGGRPGVIPTDAVRHLVHAAVVVAYVLVAVTALRFLTRIGERTRIAAACTVVAGAVGALLLATFLLSAPGARVLSVLLVLALAGAWWGVRRAPRSRIGVFDHAEPDDVLPGSGRWVRDGAGQAVLVPDETGEGPS